MTDLIPFSFESHQVRIITDDNGDPLFVAKDVAEALGYTWNGTARIEHVPEEWRGVTSVVTPSGMQEMAVLREPGFYFFLNRSDKPGALPLQKLVSGEILPSIRKTGRYDASKATREKPDRQRANSQLSAKMTIARAAASMLRMSETSKIRMLAQIAESEGIAPTFLPDYVGETLTKALTPMLTDLKHPLATKVRAIVHPALEAMGILERMSRHSGTGSGQIKHFWSLTEEGLQFGRNETSPHNPRQTIPLYFVATFPALLSRLDEYLRTRPNLVLIHGDGEPSEDRA